MEEYAELNAPSERNLMELKEEVHKPDFFYEKFERLKCAKYSLV